MSIEAMKQALRVFEKAVDHLPESKIDDCINSAIALRQAIDQAEKQEPVAFLMDGELFHVAEYQAIAEQGDGAQPLYAVSPKREQAEKQEPLITMNDAVSAGDSVLLNEQAALLRECRFSIDHLIKQKPALAGLLCGSTTLGNLRAELYKYRPKGVFGGTGETK